MGINNEKPGLNICQSLITILKEGRIIIDDLILKSSKIYKPGNYNSPPGIITEQIIIPPNKDWGWAHASYVQSLTCFVPLKCFAAEFIFSANSWDHFELTKFSSLLFVNKTGQTRKRKAVIVRRNLKLCDLTDITTQTIIYRSWSWAETRSNTSARLRMKRRLLSFMTGTLLSLKDWR